MADDAGFAEAFGYGGERPPPEKYTQLSGFSLQVMTGLHSETLETVVILRWKLPDDGPVVDIPMPPDLADTIASEMHDAAERARNRSLYRE